jgi:hypothetical protein
LAELHPEELRDEVELGERHEAPVSGSDDHQDQRRGVELPHLPLLSVEVLSR